MLKKIFIITLVFLYVLTLPDNFSWGSQGTKNYLGPIYNQNNPHRCESGWAISTTNALSARINIAMDKMGFHSPSVSLSAQSLLECDNLDFGCLGVFIFLSREIQDRLSDGSSETTSQILAVILIRPKVTQMDFLALLKVDARLVGLKETVKDRRIRRFTALKQWKLLGERKLWQHRLWVVVLLFVEFQLLFSSKHTTKEFLKIQLERTITIITLWYMAGVRKDPKNSGEFKIHMDLHGERKVQSE